jgi:predicted nuclease of predicted toxin-antitoxin system
MTIWIDAHLSPSLAAWINRNYPQIQARSISSLNLQYADDRTIFESAKIAASVIMSKDSDFLKLVDQFGPPPQIIWITCGNTSNARMREILEKSLQKAMNILQSGEPVVEIGDRI